MTTHPIERPVTPLRQRMLDDMAMRSMASRTQHDYVVARGQAAQRPAAARLAVPRAQLHRSGLDAAAPPRRAGGGRGGRDPQARQSAHAAP